MKAYWSTILLTLVATWIAGHRLIWAVTENVLQRGSDFGIFFRGAQCLASGLCDPYIHALNPAPNLLPPHGLVIFRPLVVMSLPDALAVWLTVSIAALTLAVVLTVRAIGVQRDWRWWALGVALFAGSCIGMSMIRMGNLYAALTLLLVLAWRWDRTNQHPLGVGIAIGVIASLKLLALLFLAWFIWRRKWKTATGMAATVLCVYGVGLTTLGPDVYTGWVHALGETARSGSMSDGSILQTTLRVFLPTTLFQPVLVSRQTAAGVAAVLMLGVGAVTFWRAHGEGGWLLVTTAALLLSPKGWNCAGMWLIVMALGYWPHASRTARRLLLVAAGIAWLPEYTPMIGQPNRWLTPMLGSMVFWMFLLSWIAACLPVTRPAWPAPPGTARSK